jgi:hypothetical protein
VAAATRSDVTWQTLSRPLPYPNTRAIFCNTAPRAPHPSPGACLPASVPARDVAVLKRCSPSGAVRRLRATGLLLVSDPCMALSAAWLSPASARCSHRTTQRLVGRAAAFRRAVNYWPGGPHCADATPPGTAGSWGPGDHWITLILWSTGADDRLLARWPPSADARRPGASGSRGPGDHWITLILWSESPLPPRVTSTRDGLVVKSRHVCRLRLGSRQPHGPWRLGGVPFSRSQPRPGRKATIGSL